MQQKQRSKMERLDGLKLLVLKMERWLQAKECRRPSH